MTSSDELEVPMAWLEHAENSDYSRAQGNRFRSTIKAMLQRPMMPEEPTKEITNALYNGYWNCHDYSSPENWKSCYRALYAHLAAPKTKEVDVEGWAIISPDGYVGVFQRTKADAETWLWRCVEGSRVIRLTGKATVPA